MRKQRGVIADLYLYGIILIGAAIGVAFCVYLWTSYVAGVEQKGYDRGKQVTEAGFALRDNQQLTRVIALKDAAEKRAQEAEAKAAIAEKTSVNQYQKGIKDGKATTERLIAFNTRLHDPGKPDTGSTACSGQPGSPSPGPAVAGSNAAAGAELSAAASQFLLRLTGEADEVVKQLRLAQAKITSDLEACNAPPPSP